MAVGRLLLPLCLAAMVGRGGRVDGHEARTQTAATTGGDGSAPIRVTVNPVVDGVFGAPESRLPSHMARVEKMWQVAALLGGWMTLIGLLGLSRSASTWLGLGHGVLGSSLHTAFFAVGLYMVFTSIETVAVSRGASWVAHSVLAGKPQQPVPWGLRTVFQSLLGPRAEPPVPVAVSTDHTRALVSDVAVPSLCAEAYRPNDAAFNAYPVGSAMRAYNTRRVYSADAGGNVEMEAVKDHWMSNATGYLNTRQARLFSGISNQCEEKAGDVGQCCDAEVCRQEGEQVDVCLRQRCPGWALYAGGGKDHCGCIEHMTSMGLIVDNSQIALCSAQILRSIRETLFRAFRVQDRRTPACGVVVIDGSDMAPGSGLVPQDYAHHALPAEMHYPAWSRSLAPKDPPPAQNVGVSLAAQLTTCGTAGKAARHWVQVRYRSPAHTATARLRLDGGSGMAVSFAAADGYRSDAVFLLNAPVRPGPHVLTIEAEGDGKFPQIHRIALCREADCHGECSRGCDPAL